MSSTFGSLNIAKTGLQYQQVAIDTANNNIANVNTDGYVRRRAVAGEVGGPGQPVMWSTWNGHGQGVTTQQVQRLTDILMGSRVRTEHGNLSYLQVQQSSMERVEAGINEPTDVGVAAMLAAFGSSWQDVVNAPDGDAARASVVAAGQSLAAAITTQARALSTEVDQQRAAVTVAVGQINDDAAQLAALNHSIFIAQANGSDVGDLEDQRDLLALDLANKAGATISVQEDGRYAVTVGGIDLVPPAGNDKGPDVANTLVVNDLATSGDPTQATSITFTMQGPDGQPITDATTGDPVAVTVSSGELGGEAYLLNHTLKNYRSQLNDLATALAAVVNAQHKAGTTADGTQGGEFFHIDPTAEGGAAAGIAVVATAADIAASASAPSASGDKDATNADRISQVLLGTATDAVPEGGAPLWTDMNGVGHSATDINDLYQSMVTGLGSTVAGLNTQTSNQQLLTNQVDDQNEQTGGVSLDEETINLMAAQRAYEASSRVLSVMNSILDTLINRTGA